MTTQSIKSNHSKDWLTREKFRNLVMISGYHKYFDRYSCNVMSVVLGEDPESEEEIDTSQIDQLSNAVSKDARRKVPRGEVVAGEESETDEEDDTEEIGIPVSPFITSSPHSPSPDPAHDT